MADHLDVAPHAGATLAVVEHRVGAGDAGVDDRDRDAGALQLVADTVAVEVDGALVHVVTTGGPVRGVGERLQLPVGPVDPGGAGALEETDLRRRTDGDDDADPVEHGLHAHPGASHGAARGGGVAVGLHHDADRLQAAHAPQVTGQLGPQDGTGVDDRLHRRGGAGHAGSGLADQGVGGQRDERGAGRGGGDCGAHHQPRGGTAGHGSSLVRGPVPGVGPNPSTWLYRPRHPLLAQRSRPLCCRLVSPVAGR